MKKTVGVEGGRGVGTLGVSGATVDHAVVRGVGETVDLAKIRKRGAGGVAGAWDEGGRAELQLYVPGYLNLVLAQVQYQAQLDSDDGSRPGRSALVLHLIQHGLGRILASPAVKEYSRTEEQVALDQGLPVDVQVRLYRRMGDHRFFYSGEGGKRGGGEEGVKLHLRCSEGMVEELGEKAKRLGVSVSTLGGVSLMAGVRGLKCVRRELREQMEADVERFLREVEERRGEVEALSRFHKEGGVVE